MTKKKIKDLIANRKILRNNNLKKIIENKRKEVIEMRNNRQEMKEKIVTLNTNRRTIDKTETTEMRKEKEFLKTNLSL